MPFSDILGTQIIDNSWMNTDQNPATNAPGHTGSSLPSLFDLSARSGSGVVRVPLTLTGITKDANGGYLIPDWQLNFIIRPILDNAAARTAAGQPVQVLFELADRPSWLSANQTAELADVTKAFIGSIYDAMPQYASRIAAWEIANEPNEGHIGAYINNPAGFADYVSATANALTAVEAQHSIDIKVIAGAIAYNAYDYMQGVFARLGNNPNIDGFAIHPYTYSLAIEPITDPSNLDALRARRPTEWTQGAAFTENDFQGAIYNLQQLMNDHGYAGKGLWVTETGSPSWLGYRNSGTDGRNDQARWIAEAMGVLESWDNSNLKSALIHSTLDFQTGPYNDGFSIYDSNPNNNNNGLDGETSFGLFERMFEGGPIIAKPAAYVVSAMHGDFNPVLQAYTQDLASVLAGLRIVVGTDAASTVDLTNAASGAGYMNGSIVLARGGDDVVSGSAFADVLFAGDGNDLVHGNVGDDRLYGGAGNDTLYGEVGNDDLYGNTGNDIINAGPGTNRVDGGTGYDVLVLEGRRADYQISGDGQHLQVVGLDEVTDAYNVEGLYFIQDGTSEALTNTDQTRGNGAGTGAVAETLYQNSAGPTWATGTSSNDVFVVGAASTNYRAGLTLDGKGIVLWNGADFDILSGIETIRFTDRDVRADSQGRFIVNPDDAVHYETLYADRPETQWLTGNSSNDVFVINASSQGYGAGRTLDGTGIVVWNGAKFDILTGFDTIRFTNGDVKANADGTFTLPSATGPGSGETIVLNDAGSPHHFGTTANDVFVMGGASASYGFGRTLDGTGVVVWQGSDFDILNGFETIRFTDRDIAISSII